MSEDFIRLRDIHTFLGSFCVKVMITKKNQMRNFITARNEECSVFECNLLDSCGGEMQLKAFGDVAKRYYDVIQQGKCYIIENVSVAANKGNYAKYTHIESKYHLILKQVNLKNHLLNSIPHYTHLV